MPKYQCVNKLPTAVSSLSRCVYECVTLLEIDNAFLDFFGELQDRNKIE